MIGAAAGPEWNVAIATVVLVAIVVASVLRARAGRVPTLRPLPGIDAVSRAVAGSVASRRPVIFVAGSRDLDNMQTVAALALLEPVAKLVAEHGGELIVPANRSMVMEAARAACRRGYAEAGREDAWDDDAVTYVSDDPLGFVARVDGLVARLRPGACFFFGFFASESLLLAEGGRQVGAVQIAGTASPVQLPFFVASCDHVLMGEELFAAGAAMSGDRALLGSLRGQDLGKAVAVAVMVVGAVSATLAAAGVGGLFERMADVVAWALETR